MTAELRVEQSSLVLIVGYGAHGQAVADALTRRGLGVTVADDRPSERARAHAASHGVSLTVGPTGPELVELVRAATHLVPTPGLPDHHPAFAAARAAGVPVIGEFDLANQWDNRPIVAVTGTNGKTTVTTLVTEMLRASGRRTLMAGNMDVPLVTAIDDPSPELFVVEASSFRLGHASTFAPQVGVWLNFEPDHLDAHASLAAYEAAKARIWRNLGPDGLAIANIDDATVMRNVPSDVAVQTFGPGGDAYCDGGALIIHGEELVRADELHRRLPHDLDNALAAALAALGAGASRDGVQSVLRSFRGIAHRMELIADVDGVRWFNDSKATTPHAVLAGLAGFDSAVLIAGGRNKGVDLTELTAAAGRLRAVVAIGEAAGEVADAFGGTVAVSRADSMVCAVETAGRLSEPGDAVVLSPACTSYDWYPNYERRGEDFTRVVHEYLESA